MEAGGGDRGREVDGTSHPHAAEPPSSVEKSSKCTQHKQGSSVRALLLLFQVPHLQTLHGYITETLLLTVQV